MPEYLPTNIITGLEPQPYFPIEDISESNAAVLELMLANSILVENGHLSAEQASKVYQAGHPAMRAAARRVLFDSSVSVAFDHGVSAYETIAAFVHTPPNYKTLYILNVNALGLTSALAADDLRSYIDDATQKFNSELPRTAGVVEESSKRFYGAMARYAVFGAGLARQFELEALE